MKNQKSQQGFTLIEILLVMALIAALATIVLVAINPAEKFKQSRDTQRYTDTASLAGAVQQYYVDHQGSLPAGIDTTPKSITAAAGATNIDLCAVLVTKYLVVMPIDPKTGTKPTTPPCTGYASGYTIAKESATSDRVVVTAVPESADSISVTR